MKNDPDYKEFRSSASCNLSEIKGIIFGGLSSRFWLFRKHINNLQRQDLNRLPFYSWQCLTIQLEGRDIDLVVPDDRDMDKLLRVLIYNMKTVNGDRGSAVKLIEALNK